MNKSEAMRELTRPVAANCWMCNSPSAAVDLDEDGRPVCGEHSGGELVWSYWPERVLYALAALVLAVVILASCGCTYARYNAKTGDVTIQSLLQKRALLVEGDGARLVYGSGSVGINIAVPAYGALGEAVRENGVPGNEVLP